MRITRSARRHGVSDEAIRQAVANAIRLVDTDDRLFVIGADAARQLLELVARSTEADDLVVFHAMAPPTRQCQEVLAMTKTHNPSGEPDPALAERLAPMTIAGIDAMSDQEIAEIMGGTAEDIAAEPAWTWREAAKAATDEYADRLAGHSAHARAWGFGGLAE